MYILGIEPALPKPHYLSNLHIIRVGLPSLLTDLRNLGHQVKIFMEEIESIKLEDIKEEMKKADLVAISTISATQPRGDYFAELAHREFAKPVVMGGSHVSFCQPEEALKFADYVIRFEGEISLPLLVESLEGKRGLNSVPNLLYRNEAGEIVQNPISPGPPDLNNYSFVDYSLISGWKKSYVTSIETSRGCPYRCIFCCVPMVFPKVKFREIESVVEEIKKWDPEFLFFPDDNFVIDPERSKNLLSLMLKKLDRIPRWGAQIRISIGKDKEWLRLAKRTNGSFFCVGLESINSGSLKEMDKRQTLEEIRECLSGFKEAGLLKALHGSFAVGFDSDTKETALMTADLARKEEIPSIQIWVLTPLIGTKLYSTLKEQGRLLSYEPGDCDGTKALFLPAQMTFKELQESVFAGMKRFYSVKNRLMAVGQGIKDLSQHYIHNLMDTRAVWQENFREAILKWYGRNMIKSIEKRAKQYLSRLKESTKGQ